MGNILEEDAVTLRKLTENRQERIYLVEGANKELAALQQKNKQLQVQHNMLKLKVEQIQKTLAKEDTSVISLERQKLELETVNNLSYSIYHFNLYILNNFFQNFYFCIYS